MYKRKTNAALELVLCYIQGTVQLFGSTVSIRDSQYNIFFHNKVGIY